MNPTVKLATMLIVVVALGNIGTTAMTAFADQHILPLLQDTEDTEEDWEHRSASLERADEAIYKFTDPEHDIEFHHALCLAGISTEALDELGGCEALPPRD